jgi:hypothetical protein
VTQVTSHRQHTLFTYELEMLCQSSMRKPRASSAVSSERACMCHTNPTPYWKYVLLHDPLTSDHKAGHRASNVANTCTTT